MSRIVVTKTDPSTGLTCWQYKLLRVYAVEYVLSGRFVLPNRLRDGQTIGLVRHAMAAFDLAHSVGLGRNGAWASEWVLVQRTAVCYNKPDEIKTYEPKYEYSHKGEPHKLVLPNLPKYKRCEAPESDERFPNRLQYLTNDSDDLMDPFFNWKETPRWYGDDIHQDIEMPLAADLPARITKKKGN